MIRVDRDDIAVSCLNVPDNQLPTVILAYLEAHEPYVYMDTSDLREHMYTIDSIAESLEQEGIEVEWWQWIKDIGAVMNEHGCGYFRIIAMGVNQ